MCSSINEADEAQTAFSVARGRLLRAVGALVCDGSWRGDGAGNLAAWLCARWQISYPVARELVQEAEALAQLPALAATLEAGAISAEQCKALTVLCGSDDEGWLETLDFWSLPELQREARKKKARELERRDHGVYLRMEHTSDERYVRGTFQLHPEDGAIVLKAVEALVPDGTTLRDWDRATATALVELAKGRGNPATVVVNIDHDVASLDSGGFVGAETVRRLSCDARVQTVRHDASGGIAGIGRTSRSVPPWLRRVVGLRDGSACTFPGCGRDRHLGCHHIVPWSNGGATDASNLLTTCWTHHKLLHEGGWSIRGDAGPDVVWLRPDGSPFEPRVRVLLDTS